MPQQEKMIGVQRSCPLLFPTQFWKAASLSAFLLLCLSACPVAAESSSEQGKPKSDDQDAGSDGADPTAIEAVEELVDETGCIFGYYTWSGKPCKDSNAIIQERETEYATLMHAHKCPDEKRKGTLEEFCGITFDEDDVVTCPCCADHLQNQPPQRASLLVPGERTISAAWVRNDKGDFCKMGHLPIWSLGGDRVPMLWCDAGILKCECFDPSRDWHEEEPRCSTGKQCSAPAVPHEQASFQSAQGSSLDKSPIAVGDRVRSKVEIFYPPGHTCLKDHPSGLTLDAGAKGTVTSLSTQADIDLVVEWDQMGGLGAGCVGAGAVVYNDQVLKFEEDQLDDERPVGLKLPPCTALDKVPANEAAAADALKAGERRYSIGGRLCDNMNADQCNNFFSTKLLEDGQRLWHFCSLDQHALRLCSAEVVKEDKAQKTSIDWQTWAVGYTYVPTREWPIVLQDTTFRVDPTYTPPAAELQDALLEMQVFEWSSGSQDLEWLRERWAKHHWKHHRFSELKKEKSSAARLVVPVTWLCTLFMTCFYM